ncbi:hypothetical protein HYX00_02520 [Candidatus Woesearchaeota archaeon]|nr:hypothetical protein [Candidatus Woesearchaeota archaeon]
MRKEIVFDSSTAILLAKIHLLGALTEKFRIIFSENVKEETTKKKDSFDSKLINRLITENKIQVLKVNNPEVTKLIQDFGIEIGEADGLVLAKEKNALFATDDGPCIKACKILDIKFATSIHFLIRLYENRLLDKEIAFEKLKALEKYGRYSYDIIKDAKNKIEGE